MKRFKKITNYTNNEGVIESDSRFLDETQLSSFDRTWGMYASKNDTMEYTITTTVTTTVKRIEKLICISE